MNSSIEAAMNNQIKKEEFSSRLYLAMAIWCEANGYPGAASFLYVHAEEERMHQMKMIHYLNDRGGLTVLSNLEQPKSSFDSLQEVFREVLDHEKYITESINELYGLTIEQKDYTTGNFLQWFITEQVEEESLMSTILDKINLVGHDKAGMFHIDKELEAMASATNSPGV